MESQVKAAGLIGRLLPWALLFSFTAPSGAQGQVSVKPEEGAAQIELRKTPLKTRQYQGKTVEGEERVISRGDSLWKILIQDKGLAERRFDRYLIIIGSLNPHIKKPDVLRVGDTIFIPIRPDEILGIQLPPGKGETRVYRVRQGDYLYKILREQFGIQEKREIRNAFDRVRELNPGKKNWNLLFVGESILFPGEEKAPAVAQPEPAKPMEVVGLDYGHKLRVQENLHLLEQIVGALGNEVRRGGEEVVPLKEGTVYLDRDSYPVVHNPKLDQRVILDLEGKIPASLKSKLEAPATTAPVVSAKKGASLHDTVSHLLSRLGFQSLPANRPVVIQDKGVGLQVKGEWMVTAPQESGGKQEVFIISLTDSPGRTPDYLKDYLSIRGMSLKEILLPPPPSFSPSLMLAGAERKAEGQFETWPRDKVALIDAFLKSHQISFSSSRQVSVPLREGIRLDTRIDRLFEHGGRKVGLLFRSVGVDVRKGLQEKEGIRAIEIDVFSLSTRELIARLFEALGERASYQEHRFAGAGGGARDKLVLTVAGFFLPSRSLLVTDRDIPKDLRRFFADKGLRVVQFQ